MISPNEEIYQKILEGTLPERSVLAKLIKEEPEEVQRTLQAKALIDIATVQEEIEYADGSDKGEVARLNAKLTHLRWCAERLLPKMYGNKQQIELTERTEIGSAQIDEVVEKALEKVVGGTIQPPPVQQDPQTPLIEVKH